MADQLLSAIQSYRQKRKSVEDESLFNAIREYRMKGVEPTMRSDIEKVEELEAVPRRITNLQPLPVGGEPMVGGPDVLAMEEGQTKTFMEGPEGKPVEVRRAQAIGLTGKPIPEPISPDGMSLQSRGALIKEKQKELQNSYSLPFSEYRTKVEGVRGELQKLQEIQRKHEASELDFLGKLITGKKGVEVEVETGLGEQRVTGPEGKITKVAIPTRGEAAKKAVMDFRQQIDGIIANDNFLEYAQKKGLTTQGFWERKLGRVGIGSEEYQNEIEQLKKNPEARKLAEEWAMTTPDFLETVGELFGRTWDGYAGAIGSGTVGPLGLVLKEAGFENAGQTLIDSADYADQMRKLGQDPRKFGDLAQYGLDISTGVGFTGGAIVAGVFGNTLRTMLGLNTARAINIFKKGQILGFGGLNSAWSGYSEARANGASDEQAKQAALFSALTQAPLELVSPLEKWIGRFDPSQQKRIYQGLSRAAIAVIEGSQEAVFNEMPQQIAGNLVKKFVYDPNQDIFEGTAYAGGVGGAAGLITSILTQMLGVKKTQQQAKTGNELGSEESDIDSEADKESQDLAPDPESALAAQMMVVSDNIDNLKEEIANDEMGLQAFEEGTPERQQAQMAIDVKKANLTQLEDQFAKLSAAPAPAAKEAAPTEAAPETKEQINTRIKELNKEFDALAEEDTAGQERVNRAIFAEQNKLAELTAIEQGVEPQAVTPTRAAQPPPSGRQYPYGTFYPERPVLQAFVKAADKAIKGIRVAGKRAQKLKNAIRTNIARNAGFLAGINAEVISSEDYGKLTGNKQVAADSGTYRAAYFGGKKYLVLPDVNQLTATTIKEEQRAASRDAALDQEARAADKKLEEEMIHLSMYQALQDEYAALKKPKQTEQQYLVSRIGQIAQEVKRTNPNAVPGVSEAYLGQKGTLDDVAFSMEFMRMVIQRVRTGQITEDLNAIRKAEAEAFSDESRGAIIALKNSILNALKFVRNSLARYLGKGTSTREVKRMENSINAILDEYGIVKGEANYEFKDYSAAQPKGEVSLTITPTEEAAPAEPTEVIEEKADPNTEVESEVVDIENLADDATYEQIEEAAPATMVNLKASTKNVAGSFQQFSKILGDSFKSLVRFAQTIWKKIGLITVAVAGASVITSAPLALEYQNLQGPKGRADLRPTGLIKGNQNFFKPYLKKTTVEELAKSLETPAETLDLIRNAINQAQPFAGNVDIDFNSIDQFADSIKPEDFPSGNTKRSYSYNPLLEISADDVKNAAQSLKTLAKDKAKIESRIRQIMGAMEFFTKKKFKDVKIIVRQTSPSEAATFMALGRAGGFPTSRAQYNPQENTIELQPQTLISLAEDGVVATSSASNIANELTHNLQFTTNNGQPLGILGIKLSDFDTASTFLTMQMPVYSKNGKLFQTINAESNWADILVGKYFGAKNNIQPKSIESIMAEQPKMQKALQEKETTDFVDSIGDMSGMSSQEIIARAGVTPTVPAEGEIVARAATPQQVQAATRSTESKNALELIRGNYGELSDIINDIITRNSKIADALEKIAVQKTNISSFDGETVKINSTYTGPKLVETINHEIVHAFLAVALREVPSFRNEIDSIRKDAIERAKYSDNPDFRNAVRLINDARALASGPIFPIKKNESLSQYMVRNSDKVLKAWRLNATNPIINYNIFESAYALASNDEFLAHMFSDQRFREELKTYKVFTPDNRNLFQKFIDAVRGLFQKVAKVEKNILDKAMEQVEYVVQLPEYNPRPIKGIGEILAKTDRGIVARAGVTPQMDRDYLAAVERGDMETAQEMVNDASGFSKINPPKKVNFYRNYLEIAARQGYYTQEEVEKYSNQFADPATEGVTAADRERDFIKYWVAEKILENGIEQNWRQSLNLSEAIVPNDSTPKQARASVANWVNTILPPETYDDAGNIIPLSQRFDVTTPLIARAATTPKVVSEQRRITNEMLGELNDMIATLQPKRSRAGKEYVSRTTKKGKTYPASLVSPYSRAANLYTSNTYEESTKALNKLFTKNPDADFFTVVTEVATQTDRYGLTESEKSAIIPLLYRLLPAYREQIMESKGAIKDRENIALKSLDLEDNLAKLIVDQQQASARTLNAAKVVRQIGGAGTAVAAYKSKVIDALADLYTIIRGDFTKVAEAVRGDRRKAVDNVFTLKEVLSRISELKKKAEKNPQAAVDSIRKAIAGKKTRKAREIVLEFCAAMFDTNGDKYANMIVDETAKAIMSIGVDRKEFSSDNVYRYIYQAFSAVAKQTAKEQAQKGLEPKAKEPKKREGKFLAQVKTVIGNDKAYKEFINQLKAKIGENYQDKAQFESDYKELFSMLGDRQWSDSMRNQAIKDSADFLDYKFNDLITYIGENRYAAQAAVKAHIKAELANVGATDEQIDKFIEEAQNYLDEETAKRVKKSLGFDISKKTGRIIGGKIEREAMKKVATAEERFQLAKTLKGLTKLAATDQRAFLDKLNELIITELGFDEATSKELSKYIEEQMAKAIQAQKSENLQKAIERAQETLSNNKIKAKANQRTILQRLIEMANMGQLDEFGVYEAFRQTHDFGKGYLEWNPNLANQLREWGDRIAALPEGLTRGIEEQKLGRFMLENQVFSGRDYFSSYWYFALLSGVGTQAINITSGVFNLLGNIAVWGVYTKGKSVGPMMRALYRSIIAKEATSRNAFSYVMQTGLNPSGMSDQNTMKYPKINVFEGANPGNTPKWAYNIITFGDGKIDSAPAWLNATLATVSPKSLMRLMRAVDAFIREAAFQTKLEALGANPYQKNQYDQAKEQAIRELDSSKSTGKEKQREIILRANEIYAQQRVSEEKLAIADEAAEETVFRQEPEGLIGRLAGYANSMLAEFPNSQLFIPFTNTVANVLNSYLNYTPLFATARLAGNIELVPLLKGKIKITPRGMKAAFIKGREDRAAEIAIKGMIGFVASFVPFILDAIQGGDDEERKLVEIYDAGPSDPEQNRIWKDNGGIPYSIRVGDKYVSYLFTPLVIPLASGAKILKWAKENEKKEQKKPVDLIEKYATVFLAPLGVGFVASLEQSFLTGVSDLVDLKNSTNIPRDTLRIASNIVSRLLVPGIVRDFQKMIIDERVEGDNIASNLLKEMPGSSEFLDKKLGYFGDPARYNSIIEENGLGRRAFSLIGRLASSETPDPAFQIMYRNGIIPPKWQGSLQWSNEIKMTKAEQREFVSIAGPIMKEWIIENEEIINDLTTEEAQDYISNNFSQIRRAVKADLEFEKGIGLD